MRILDYRKGDKVLVSINKEEWITGVVDHFISGDIPIVVVKTDNHPKFVYVYCISEECIKMQQD